MLRGPRPVRLATSTLWLVLSTGLLFSLPMTLLGYWFLTFAEDLGVALGRPREPLPWPQLIAWGTAQLLVYGGVMGLFFGRVERPLPPLPAGALEGAMLHLGFGEGEPVQLRGAPALRFAPGRWRGNDDLVITQDPARGAHVIGSRFSVFRLRRALARAA